MRPGPRAGAAGVLGGGGFSVQHLPSGPTYKSSSPLDPHMSVWIILLGIVIAVLTVTLAKLVTLLIPRLRRAFVSRRRRIERLQATAVAEERARAMMDELCPHGWRAQITLFGLHDELPEDAPADERSRVALDWAELEDERRGVAIVRRVWATTVADALERMVADRRTDETLEQIEQSAAIDGTLWPDF